MRQFLLLSSKNSLIFLFICVEELLPTASPAFSPSAKRALIFFVIVLGALGILFVGAFVYSKAYDDRVLPGVAIGQFSGEFSREPIPVGGMGEQELRDFLTAMDDKISGEPVRIAVKAGDKEKEVIIDPATSERDMVTIDIDAASTYLLSYGKEQNFVLRSWRILNTYHEARVPLTQVQVDTPALIVMIKEQLTPFETKAQNADMLVTSIAPYAYEITPAVNGIEFSYTDITNRIVAAWSSLRVPTVSAVAAPVNPDVSEEEVAQVAEKGKELLEKELIELLYRDEHTKHEAAWTIKPSDIAPWLQVQKGEAGSAVIGLKRDLAESYLKSKVEPKVHREPRNAKLVMDGERIDVFEGSRPGISLKYEDIYQAMNTLTVDRFLGQSVSSTIAVAVTTVEPKITTADVNEWGIEEVLGVGYSSYKGSPGNRIKNIRFAVNEKLNGKLIKPGETFSMLEALRPFTEEGGYLPELVIKGDRIKPEIGGGLCQVGSTMFRAAMNAALPIEERRNHSLTVSYYNDHRNNLPGTDATIYDPAPDFKFKNDTDSNVLITTEMNEKTQELFFTLWGKGDGRKGYYSEPVVSKWIPTGPTKEVITDELSPGQKKCQEPHIGAVASFTYTREMPNGEKIDRVFESYYRPLPRICLVGAAEAVATETSDAALSEGVITDPGPADAAIPLE